MSFFGFSCFSDSSATEAAPAKGTPTAATSSPISNPLAMTHYNVGCTLQGEGKLDEAIKEYRKAIEADAKFCDAHYNLANGELLIFNSSHSSFVF